MTKTAIDYLSTSGATAISIIETEGVCSFRVGLKIDQNAVSVYWVRETDARSIVKHARRDAGRSPDAARAGRALAQAAADHRQTLTPNDVAMARAGVAVTKLDAYLESLRGTGTLKEFNRAFKQHRVAAMAHGQGFMMYKVAQARLRAALIPLLVAGKTVDPSRSLFAEIFRQE
jgi:hypothetical protein